MATSPAAIHLLCACIDIGSNTTRVLVAEASGGRLTEVLQRRAFTRLGRGLKHGAAIPRAKIDEVAHVVAEQRALAEAVGAHALRAVATAAIRGASNRDEVVDAVRDAGGLELTVLDGHEEARLAFLGATRTLGQPLHGRVAVVDVGGGSSEIAVGTVAGGVEWCASFRMGSSYLTEHYVRSDPPAAAELHAMREHAHGALEGLDIPPVDCALAVGGSATSVRRLVGAVLEPETMQRALRVLSSAPAAEVAWRFAIEPERVPLMAAGILILDAASVALGRPLQIGCGGLREGVVLDMANSGAMMRGEP
jgi:exopolyphosphatase / guanosine-5'-triphosphate,3'-diphosphate pyrophosphatase